MSIFTIEIKQNKRVDEDALTSKVFGIFDLVNRKILVKPFLEMLKIKIPNEEIDMLKIGFWQTTGQATPDIVFVGKDTFISIEAKYGGTLARDQLIKEYEDIKQKKNCHLVTITSDFTKPLTIQETINFFEHQNIEPNIHWTNWHSINSMIKEQIGHPELDKTGKRLVQHICELMDTLGFRKFTGFRHPLDQISIRSTVDFFEDMALLVGDVAKKLELELSYVYKGYMSTVVNLPKYWLPDWIEPVLLDKKWIEGKSQVFIFIRSYLKESPVILRVGYALPFDGGWEIHKEILKNKIEDIIREVSQRSLQIFSMSEDESVETENLKEIIKKEWKGINFCFDLTEKEINHPNTVEIVTEKIKTLMEFANNLALFATYEQKENHDKQQKQEEPLEE